MTNEMLELADRIDTCIRKRIYDVGLSQDEKAAIVAALRSTAAQADVRDIERISRAALAAFPSTPAPVVSTIDSVPSCGQENDYQRAALLKP